MRRLLIVSLVAVTLPAFAAPVVLERMEVVSDPAPGVRLTLSAPVAPLAHPLREPERITLDLPGTKVGPKVRQPLDGSGPLARIRLGQLEGGTARVVLDLTEHAPFTVETNGRVVTLVLSAHPATPAVTEPAPEPAPAPAAPAAQPPIVDPSAVTNTSASSDDGERSSTTRGLFLDYTGLFAGPDAPAFPEPERQPHLHVGQQQP
jgi:hypothetical protein